MSSFLTEAVGRPTASDRFVVLTVCVGNICRSPVAALLLQHDLDGLVQASSAGTRAVVGAPVHPEMAARLQAAGIPAETHAEQLTEAMVRSADLVLTMTRPLRSEVVATVPAAVRRTFTLPELAAIAEREPNPTAAVNRPNGLGEVVARAAAHRSAVAGLGDALDIADPYGRGSDDYEHAFAEIRRCVGVLRRWLVGPSSAGQ